MRLFANCDFGHLLMRTEAPPFGEFYAHVHEFDALECAYFEDLGWPRPEVSA